MRVIAGRARGRKLEVPDGKNTRPTPDRVREALFSILAIDFTGLRVLDLFAGSGALGIEALSRGADEALFVESHRTAVLCLRRNLGEFSLQSRVVAAPVAPTLRDLGRQKESFSLVFLDPPYALELGTETLRALKALGLVRPGGIIVCEHASRLKRPVVPEGWQILRARTFGEVSLLIIAAQA